MLRKSGDNRLTMKPAVPTSFDIAFWFLDRARSEDGYLQPRALQCLLFLAQAHFAAAHGGRRLMPAVFVIDDAGPFDPNLYRMFENGRPKVTEFPLDEAVLVFLDAVWRRYRNADALRLEQIVARAGAEEKAVQARSGAEITTAAMCRMFGEAPPGAQRSGPPAQQPQKSRKKAAGPRIMTSHTGKKVTVTAWQPKRKLTT